MNSNNSSELGKVHYRTIFVSDVHLGTRGCQAERLTAFLKHHSCDELYLVGDIIDGWRMKSSGIYWPQSHNNVLRRVLTMTRRGTRVTYVTGNHDEFLRDHVPLEIGNLRVLNETTHQTADGRRLLVVHGDQFDVITRYHRWLAWLGDLGYTLLLKLNGILNRIRQRFGLGYWSLSAWIKQRVKTAVSYIGDYEDALVHQCRREGYAGVVCGHIHHAEIRDLDGIAYMNCGDWVESCTALVETRAGEFRILNWSQQEAPTAEVYDLIDRRKQA